MKNLKTLSVLALAGLMILGSCKKNEENNTTNGGFTISAGIEQPNDNAKTSLNPSNGAISWSAGDQIVVNGTSLSLLGNGGSSSGSFYTPESFAEATQFVAAYPAGATMSGKEVTFTLPNTQTLDAAGTFGNGANPMVAYTEDIEAGLTFQSVCGAMRVKLAGEGIVTKLVLTSKNTTESLWGTLKVNAENPVATGCTGGSNVITLEIPGGIAASNANMPEVFITLPDGVLAQGFKLQAYNGSDLLNEKETTSGAAAIVMNGISSPVQHEVELPHGMVATQEALNVLLTEVQSGTYTGPITLMGDEITFDFNNTVLPADEQVIIAESTEVEISNLTVTVTSASSGYPAAVVISDGANATLNNVTVTSTSTHENTRALNVIGADTEVTLIDCTIDGGNAGYSRGLNVYDGDATVNVVGGSIHAGHYAINIPSTGNGVTINLSDASIASGWAAINVWGENNTVNATNCTLRGTNDKGYNADGWNDFATIAFNNNNVNCAVNLVDCDIIAEATTGNKQYAIRMYTGNNTISIDNACTLSKGVGNPNTPNWYCYYAGSDSTGSNWYIEDETFAAFNTAWGIGGGKGEFAPVQVPFVLKDDQSRIR